MRIVVDIPDDSPEAQKIRELDQAGNSSDEAGRQIHLELLLKMAVAAGKASVEVSSVAGERAGSAALGTGKADFEPEVSPALIALRQAWSRADRAGLAIQSREDLQAWVEELRRED